MSTRNGTSRATSCCRLRYLTTVGTGWSLAGPPLKGKRSWPRNAPDASHGMRRAGSTADLAGEEQR
jgi:hypothetical protein